MEYRVELDVYNGPLDLLLYLIKKDELAIYDIPIARITDSYMHYIGTLKAISAGGLDINIAGDFLVMAATLMEIKSAMLLPKPPAALGEEGFTRFVGREPPPEFGAAVADLGFGSRRVAIMSHQNLALFLANDGQLIDIHPLGLYGEAIGASPFQKI